MPRQLFNQKVAVLGYNYDVYSLFGHLNARLEPENCFLLESIEGKNIPVYSFIAFDPEYILTVKNDRVRVANVRREIGEKLLKLPRKEPKQRQGDVKVQDMVDYRIKALDAVAEHALIRGPPRPRMLPRQAFFGGYLGFLAYDIVAPWVGYTSETQTPDVLLGMHTRVLIYDHAEGVLLYVDNTHGEEDGYLREIKTALSSYRRVKRKYPDADFSRDEFKSNTSPEEFAAMVERGREYVFDGDVFQVVLSRRVESDSKAEDLNVYGALRSLNPSPYMYYLNFGDLRMIGSSPEALVSLNGKQITTVPIAGTRRRGRTRRDEARMQKELITDPKERAEHTMLVDLARNDVAKLAVPGSVKTHNFMTVRKFKHVMHLITTVTGELRRGLDARDVLKSVFPAGTVTGAPKLRAMEIIHELEKTARGPYAGAAGYLALNGDMDWAITIRTILLHRSRVSVQAGAGIVAGSKPELEWIETENKMRSLLKALKMAEAVRCVSCS